MNERNEMNGKNPRTQYTTLYHSQNINKKSTHVLERNLKKKRLPCASRDKRAVASHCLQCEKGSEHSPLTGGSRQVCFSTVVTSPGARSTAGPGRRELHAEEG
jgi:hypothetical protein